MQTVILSLDLQHHFVNYGSSMIFHWYIDERLAVLRALFAVIGLRLCNEITDRCIYLSFFSCNCYKTYVKALDV